MTDNGSALPPPVVDSALLPEVVGPVHIPPTDVVKTKRRKSLFFDRIKVLVIIGTVFFFVVAKARADIPVETWWWHIKDQLRAKSWMVWLAGIEVVRQLHYVICEHSAGYNTFWERRIWGGWERRVGRMNPWLRFRLGRLWRWIWLGAIAAFILAALWDVPVLTAITEAPSRIWNAMFATAQGMPLIIYVAFIVGMAIIQFAAIFWFMSKGGVDTYMPDEIKTRYSDVWGQDHVLDKVKENVVFLEKPEEIEAKGGHVPGGMLLWGPPGTGKTLMAEAVAGETGRPFVFVDPGAFQNMFFGVGILKVKGLYRKLRKLALKYGGVIVFFDEADSLGSRGGAVAGAQLRSFISNQQCNGVRYLSQTGRLLAIESELTDEQAKPPTKRLDGIRRVVVNPAMGGGGGMGTLQALLTEMSGLKKPRGFINRRVRQFLGMKPKQPPKYRILHMMATNMPDALDAALLRPGRLDRTYKVDFPTLDGRIRTFEGYFDKIRHELTEEQVARLAIMSPRASGAVIKDIVNESLIVAMRDGRDTVRWPDVLEAKTFKVHGMGEGPFPTELEQHQVAIHEAGHAVGFYLLTKRLEIDIATIEQRGDVGGFVAPVPKEEMKSFWRSGGDHNVMVSLASLAAERIFFEGENSAGVGGDLNHATTAVRAMLSRAGMGDTLTSGAGLGQEHNDRFDAMVEEKLKELYRRTYELIDENRWFVLAIAHALQEHRTISGEDIAAIYDGRQGPVVNGEVYHLPEFEQHYGSYHCAALLAHHDQLPLDDPLPVFDCSDPAATLVAGPDGALGVAALVPAPNRMIVHVRPSRA